MIYKNILLKYKKVKPEYYILSDNNCMIEYFDNQNTYSHLSLNY